MVAAKRTPFGTFGGSLKGHSPVDLQVLASNAAMESVGLKPEQVDSVCIGNVLSASSPDAPYLARHVALRCGMPVPTPAYVGKETPQPTVTHLSTLQSTDSAAPASSPL